MCVCRGCIRPGRRTVWQWIRRRPKFEAPRSHAQGILGVRHGLLHDLYDRERELYGRARSVEVIQHFALTDDGTLPPGEDEPWYRSNGCMSNPHMIELCWR